MKKKYKSEVNNRSGLNTVFNTQEAAEYLGMKRKQLENFRSHKVGPRFIKKDRTCLYNKQDLDKWLEGRRSTKKKRLSFGDNFKVLKKITSRKARRIAKGENVKLDEPNILKFESHINAIDRTQSSISELETLIASKKGYFINKTDVTIFKKIVLVIHALLKDIEEIRKKIK